MKKLFAFVIAIVLALGCAAYADGGNYLFIQKEDGIYVCGYEGIETVIYLPETFRGEPVVGVAEGAFKGNRNVVELFVPDSYRIIGVEAFADCTSLRDIYFGSGLEVIDERAFRGCSDLLSISIVQNDYYEDPTAFDGTSDYIPHNGADIAYYRENNSGEDYELLYIAACDMMSRGRFAEAREVFLSLYGYELSADYYFYCSARIYERSGDIESALAIYALTPDLNDCQARIDYYGGNVEVENFFECPEYTVYYNHYFGSGGSYEGWLNGVPAQADDAEAEAPSGEDIIGGADAPTNIVIGSTLGGNSDAPDATEAPAPEPTEEPAVDTTEEPADDGNVQVSATVEPKTGLMSYHDFTGGMPYSYDNRSISDDYYALYFYFDDVQQIYDYAALFEAQGWQTMEETDADGWKYIYVMSSDTEAYFMIGFSEAEGLLILMYEADMPLGFDPVNGL